MSARTLVRFFKLCITACILLAGAYFTVKTAYPFLNELAEPGSGGDIRSKDTATSVKLLQQTRNVVAKNNAHAASVNSIIDENLPQYAAVNAPPIPALPAPPPPPLAPPKPKIQVRLERIPGLVIDQLHITSVLGGKDPRIMVDGLLLSVGDIVDAKRRLRFISIDQTQRIVVFGNETQTFEKSY